MSDEEEIIEIPDKVFTSEPTLAPEVPRKESP